MESKNKKFNYKFDCDGIVISGGNDLYSIKKIKKILLEINLK